MDFLQPAADFRLFKPFANAWQRLRQVGENVDMPLRMKRGRPIDADDFVDEACVDPE